VDREVLAPSPHTPRTNLARWGEGCKPYVGGLRLPGVLSNIARFGEEVEKSRALQKRLAYARFSHAAYAFCVFNRDDDLSALW
jgi:hypothetical protein